VTLGKFIDLSVPGFFICKMEIMTELESDVRAQ